MYLVRHETIFGMLPKELIDAIFYLLRSSINNISDGYLWNPECQICTTDRFGKRRSSEKLGVMPVYLCEPCLELTTRVFDNAFARKSLHGGFNGVKALYRKINHLIQLVLLLANAFSIPKDPTNVILRFLIEAVSSNNESMTKY